MCGFIGFTKFVNVKQYSDRLHHRGPDSFGFYQDDETTLMHNRLSIIDVSSTSDQPFLDKTRDYAIVFNGEIYNYQELKSNFNLNCRTNSDTEVILELYKLMGKKCLDHLTGIFAFCIYDIKSKSLFLARDHFGVKPLYYSLNDGVLSFSSEIKGILDESIKFNLQSVYEYMQYGLLHHNESTFFEDVFSLSPGHCIDFDLKSKEMTIRRYWDIPHYDQDGSEDTIEEVHELLQQSMKHNLVSDVEVAICLSSGTDSTLLTKMSQEHQQEFKAFTFGFSEQDYDEISRVKRNFDLNHLDLHPSYLPQNKMLSMLKESLYYFESPLGGLGTLSAYNLMKDVHKQRIKVVLAGEGADEVFGGYRYYYASLFQDLLDKDSLQNELSIYNQKHKTNLQLGTKEFKQFLELNNSDFVFAPDATSSMQTYCSTAFKDFSLNTMKAKSQFSSALSNTMYTDMFRKKLPKLLHFQDRASMANGVEARVPFLDKRLTELMYSLPAQYKIKNGETKYLLKRVLKEKYSYLERSETKHYVATPQREWLKSKEIVDEVLDTIKSGFLVKNSWVDYSKFEKDYLNYAEQEELGNSFFIWKLINLEYLLEIKWT
ncbi:MAG: asparagine synthase (glutamine-hydrolyzing) [Candidatus Cloacimonetes bacterium]|nr:asparagine synthase (glutamine-hydrolyzing) [Candidatus Cloacimonadota bacterium]